MYLKLSPKCGALLDFIYFGVCISRIQLSSSRISLVETGHQPTSTPTSYCQQDVHSKPSTQDHLPLEFPSIFTFL